MENNNQPDGNNQQPTDTQDNDKNKTFDYEYVKTLREENKQRRLESEQLKTKLAEIENKLKTDEEEKLKEQNKFKELFEKTTQEKQELENKYKEAETFKTKYETLEQERRNELLEGLDDVQKEFAKDLTTDKLTEFVKKIALKKPDVSGGKAGGKLDTDPNKTWDDYSSSDLDKLAKENPDYYNKLKKQKFKI